MTSNLVAARDFAKGSLPRHSTNGSKRERSRASSIHSPSVRLSIIEEDGDIPPMPPKAHHRPFHRRWNLGDPPRFSFETPPPKYSVWDEKGPKGEKLSDIRNKKYIARRGGWRRICLIALVIIAIIVALTVGLVVGLRKKNSDSSDSPPTPASSSNNTTAPFPAGSYTLTTHLNTVRTACVSQPSDWTCFPYTTFSQDPSSSAANFTVTITTTDDVHFSISSSNTLSIAFPSTPLSILDAGTENERYHFTTETNKITHRTGGVGCYFNDTTLAGDLYTKRAPTLREGVDEGMTGAPYGPWPYAVEMTQSIDGGQTVPQCFKKNANSEGKGDRVVEGITAQSPSTACSCDYRNFEI